MVRAEACARHRVAWLLRLRLGAGIGTATAAAARNSMAARRPAQSACLSSRSSDSFVSPPWIAPLNFRRARCPLAGHLADEPARSLDRRSRRRLSRCYILPAPWPRTRRCTAVYWHAHPGTRANPRVLYSVQREYGQSAPAGMRALFRGRTASPMVHSHASRSFSATIFLAACGLTGS